MNINRIMEKFIENNIDYFGIADISNDLSDIRFDAEDCQSYQDILIDEPRDVCVLCIYIFPYGR